MAAESPTIVLVHGAWADATGFDAEIRALRDRGHTAIGFGNPLRDLFGDAAYLAEFLRTLSGPIVLVGHSYGGNVISTAAIDNDQVQALVYFNGWMCDVGESQQLLLEKFEGSLVGPSIRPVPFTNPDGRRSWRCRLPTSHSCPSPRPRPSSSCKPIEATAAAG
jgi:pimeloyl-ACP methyl ester carboxylesterase